MDAEHVVWTGTSSQVLNFYRYSFCVALCIPFFFIHIAIILYPVSAAVALWSYLQVRCQKFELTSQRLKISFGVLSRTDETIELYRIRDTRLEQSFFQRFFDVSDVYLISSDAMTRSVVISSILNGSEVRELVRTYVEARRDAKGVRQLDVN
jgi:uncharacterized membrane protein YdbT with pleckstrin-like domain